MNQQPDHWPTLYQMGQSMESGGDPTTAAVYFWNAATLAPRRPLHWKGLAHALKISERNSEYPLKQYFSSLSSIPGFDSEHFIAMSSELVTSGSLFSQIRSEFDGDMLTESQLSLSVYAALMARNPLRHVEMEVHLASLRSSCLEAVTQSPTSELDPGSHALLCGLAMQCFLNEYLYPIANDEDRLLNELLASPNGLNEMQLAVVAAFRPLHRVESLSLSVERMSPWTSRLLRRQMQEPQTEYRLRKEIRKLTPITDKVSTAVQQQYEENPYPRWSEIGAPNPRTVEEIMTTVFPRLAGPLETDIHWPTAADILVAGCGTGRHPITSAGLFLESKILAIDLSLPSLAYAKRMAAEYGVRNIEFAQADILELGAIDRRFDIIESSGVLHHLAEPLKGLEVLCGLLKDGGLLRLGLYSETARRGVVAARKIVEDQGFDATVDGIRSFREKIMSLPDDNPAKIVSRSADFFTLSGLRDFAFNVQEHRYSLTQLEEYLNDFNLEFLGFQLPDVNTLPKYRERFPGDADATDLGNWHLFEQDNPDTFAYMYQFWAVKR